MFFLFYFVLLSRGLCFLMSRIHFSGMIVKIDTLNIDRAADHIRDSSEHSFGRYSGAKMNRNMKTTAALWKCFLVPFFRDF